MSSCPAPVPAGGCMCTRSAGLTPGQGGLGQPLSTGHDVIDVCYLSADRVLRSVANTNAVPAPNTSQDRGEVCGKEQGVQSFDTVLFTDFVSPFFFSWGGSFVVCFHAVSPPGKVQGQCLTREDDY